MKINTAEKHVPVGFIRAVGENSAVFRKSLLENRVQEKFPEIMKGYSSGP